MKSEHFDLCDMTTEEYKQFSRRRKAQYSATEIAYIYRFINGEENLKGFFSEENLKFIQEKQKGGHTNK